MHGLRSREGHRLCPEHQRPVDLQAEQRGPRAGRRREGRRTSGDRAGANALRATCQTCHGADLKGSGNYPSLADITTRLGPEPLREVITGGGPGMPPNNDLNQTELAALVAFLASPDAASASRGRGGGPGAAPAPGGPVVASGGAAAGRVIPPGRAGGMIGPDYPPGVQVPEVRMYTGYGMNNTIVKPPYSTLTAYDLNTGTIKWQVPAGGDDARAIAAGAKETGFISQRTGIVTTSAGSAVPRRRRQQAARLRFRHRPYFVDRSHCRQGRAGFRRCMKSRDVSSSSSTRPRRREARTG